ncbi:hypothetical protein FIBSPDRAFT_150292 [Athelia psychrophila]|uniref:Uncharacterized protein n=1 Tax=Athelia psychrophila TaxID=1759441 RepID=A0A166BMD1_9AGAM|nr:hypothetical protein FIBSPDRAFT_150292 [Fibularhizoctonia sp. CBS 109695]
MLTLLRIGHSLISSFATCVSRGTLLGELTAIIFSALSFAFTPRLFLACYSPPASELRVIYLYRWLESCSWLLAEASCACAVRRETTMLRTLAASAASHISPLLGSEHPVENEMGWPVCLPMDATFIITQLSQCHCQVHGRSLFP